MRNKTLAFAMLAALAAATGTPGTRTAALDSTFELHAGEAARIEAEDLQIGFDGVAADSRCPKGVQCIWEGDATVRVWLQKGSGAKEALELHTSGKGPASVSALGYTVRLAGLAPYPVSGRTIAPEDYVATLQAARGSDAPER